MLLGLSTHRRILIHGGRSNKMIPILWGLFGPLSAARQQFRPQDQLRVIDFRRPIFGENGVRWEIFFDVRQTDDRTGIVCEELISDALHLAAELQVAQIPTFEFVGVDFQIVGFTFEVEKWDVLFTVAGRERDHRLIVNAHEAEPIR